MTNEKIVVSNGQLSCVGHGCESVPVNLASDTITRVDMTDNRLQSLQKLEVFKNVEELILDQNHLTDQHMQTLPNLPRLHTLSLNKNFISDLDGLLQMIKKCLPSLTYLSLLCNAACPDQLSSQDKDDDDYRRYKLYVLYILPQLKFLDFSPVKPSDRAEAAQKGPYLRVVKPSSDSFKDNTEEKFEGASASTDYRPLPQQLRENASADAKATFGKCKYVYYGRHSEGNRFIRNNDL